MRLLRLAVFLLSLAVPLAALSALSTDDLPDGAKWYFHADFDEMRTSDAGRPLYAWLQDEVFDEILEETGVDLDREADYLTAFSSEDGGMVIVIDGSISQETKDKVVAMSAASGTPTRSTGRATTRSMRRRIQQRQVRTTLRPEAATTPTSAR